MRDPFAIAGWRRSRAAFLNGGRSGLERGPGQADGARSEGNRFVAAAASVGKVFLGVNQRGAAGAVGGSRRRSGQGWPDWRLLACSQAAPRERGGADPLALWRPGGRGGAAAGRDEWRLRPVQPVGPGRGRAPRLLGGRRARLCAGARPADRMDPVSLARARADLGAGRFELALSGITIRPDRSLAGRFSLPLTTTGAVALVPDTSALWTRARPRPGRGSGWR